jgi:Peptidase family M28/PDZ domain
VGSVGIVLLAGAMSFAALAVADDRRPADAVTLPNRAAMESTVAALTTRELAGRGSGTPEVEAAADTLSRWMADAGLQPAFDGSWFQSFPLSGEGWAGEDLAGKTGRNVAGHLAGAGALADRYLIIGAHYDHLGRVVPAGPGAPAPAIGEFYPGANDNASGVAVLFELIRLAAASDAMIPNAGVSRRSILFVNFGGEEVGLKGSGYMASNPPIPVENIDLMINIDTVGQMDGDRLYVSGVGTADRLPDLVASANTRPLDLSLAQGGWSGSDHMSFNTKEVPVLFIFGGPYPEYNTPADRGSALNWDGMEAVVSYLDRLVASARGDEANYEWIMVGSSDVSTDESAAGNKSTWFGSMPDFTEEIQGYKLAGVFDNSPAAKGGLLKGDVLVKFGGEDVLDLAGFTRVLRAHRPGDLVEATVLRDGKSMNFTIVLGDRSERK